MKVSTSSELHCDVFIITYFSVFSLVIRINETACGTLMFTMQHLCRFHNAPVVTRCFPSPFPARLWGSKYPKGAPLLTCTAYLTSKRVIVCIFYLSVSSHLRILYPLPACLEPQHYQLSVLAASFLIS